MTTTLVYDSACLTHDTGPGHPERADRIRRMLQALHDQELLPRCEMIKPWAIGDKLMAAINDTHDPKYVQRLEAACNEGKPFIDVPDSAICTESYHAALVSAAASLAAVDSVAQGAARNSMCLMRPPGHHCEYDESKGFCLLNNIAIAAEWLLRTRTASRVAIVDFDVHHGNGTQHIFEDRDDVLYCSVHQHPMTLYPGTGFPQERGMVGTPGINFTLNVTVMPGAGDDHFLHAIRDTIAPVVRSYAPDFLLLSAGFDAHEKDPLAQCEMTTEGYEELTRVLCTLGEEVCQGRVISMLEGGYHLTAAADSVARHVKVLLEFGEHA